MKPAVQKILMKLIRDEGRFSERSLALLSRIWPHPIPKILIRAFRETSPLSREKGLKNVFLNYAAMPTISLPPVIFIALTNRCNLSCSACSIHREKPQDFNPDILDELIDEAKKSGTKIFILMGGEPLLWPDLLTLLKKHQDVYFEIITNGTLIDDSWAEALAEMGHAAVFISLEGLEASTDKRRGKGVFAKVSRAMQSLHRNGLFMGLSILVTPENFDEVTSDAFIRQMIQQGIIMAYYLPYKPVGDHPDLSLVLSPRRRSLLYRRIMRIRKTHPIVALDHENDMSPLGGCIATRGLEIYLSADGRIKPCAMIHYSDSTLKEGRSLREAIHHSPFLRGVHSLYQRHAGCLWSDRPKELLDLIQKTFPEKHADFPDFVSLQEYAKRHAALSSQQGNQPRKDLYTRIGGAFFKAVVKKTQVRTGALKERNHKILP